LTVEIVAFQLGIRPLVRGLCSGAIFDRYYPWSGDC